MATLFSKIRLIACLLMGGLLYPVYTTAQTLQGQVTDETGKSVPFAALYLEELKTGLAADEDGRFQTTLPAGHWNLKTSSLGYQSEWNFIQIPATGTCVLNVQLREAVYQLDEVTVRNGQEDPAYPVIRKVIANSTQYKRQVRHYKGTCYQKGNGILKKVPKLVERGMKKEGAEEYLNQLFVSEKHMEVDFKCPDQWNYHILAERSSYPDGGSFDLPINELDFYGKNLMGAPSPFAPGAFRYYRYEWIRTEQKEGRLIEVIRIIPKGQKNQLLAGTVYVADGLWCLTGAQLQLHTGKLNIDIDVHFDPVEQSVYLPTSYAAEVTIQLLGVHIQSTYLMSMTYDQIDLDETIHPLLAEAETDSLDNEPEKTQQPMSRKEEKIWKKIEQLTEKPDLNIRETYQLAKLSEQLARIQDTTTSRRKYELSPIQTRHSRRDSLAGKRDSAYWEQIRRAPLEIAELNSFATAGQRNDSLKKRTEKETKPNRISRILSTLLSGRKYETSDKRWWAQVGGSLSFLPEYNLVDGFWIGASAQGGVKLNPQTRLTFEPSLYYLTARKSLAGNGSLTLDFLPYRQGRLQLAGGITSADYNSENGEARYTNGIISALSGQGVIRFYEKKYLSADGQIELANGLLLKLRMIWEHRNSLENHAKGWWRKTETDSNVPASDAFQPMPEHEALKGTAELAYTPASYYRIISGRKIYELSVWPTFRLRYDQGFPWNRKGVSPEFERLQLTIQHQVEFGLFNRLDWSVSGGIFLKKKNLQFPDFKHFATTCFPLTDYTFDTGFMQAGSYRYATDSRWAQGSVSWYAPRLLLNWLPFLHQSPLNEAVHLHTILTDNQKPYWEAGYSMGWQKIMRLGVFVGFEGKKYHSTGVSVSVPISYLKQLTALTF